MKLRYFFATLLISSIFTVSVHAQPPNNNLHDALLFGEAEKALAKNDNKKFFELSAKAKNYILYPYLPYDYLRKNINQANPKMVVDFLTTYKDTPLAPLILNRWLNSLAEKNSWQEYSTYYQDNSDLTLKCYYQTALLKTGQKQRTYKNIESIWLTTKSLPKACDPILSVWQKDKKITNALVWQRAMMAASDNRKQLTLYLTRFLNKEQVTAILFWLQLSTDPQLIADSKKLPIKNAYIDYLLMFGLQQLAKTNPEMAITVWEKLQKKYIFSSTQKQQITELIAIRLAWKKSKLAEQWLAKADGADASSVLKQWRVRNAIWRQNWPQVLQFIKELPQEEAALPTWNYWQARALTATGKKDTAIPLYQALTKKLDYYGILSRIALNEPLDLQHQPIAYTPEALTQVENTPAIQRAYELLKIGRTADARREWNYAISNMDKPQLRAAAYITKELAWHDRGIATIGQLGEREDLEITYPIVAKNALLKASKAHKIPPAWIIAVIRQESIFMMDARSPVGALGLMQVMPSTANYLRKKQKKKPLTNEEILLPENNILLGSYYLKELYEDYDKQLVLMAAAYNAGPSRVSQWLPKGIAVPPDIWIDNIAFSETRDYVKRVVTYGLIYEWRLNENATNLQKQFVTPVVR